MVRELICAPGPEFEALTKRALRSEIDQTSKLGRPNFARVPGDRTLSPTRM